MRSATSAAASDWRHNNFDLIRLLAAMQVAICHTMHEFKLYGVDATFFNLGLRLFPGVPVFFVISGFLVSKSYERSDSIGDYYRNRCLRIFPALWVCLVVSVAVILFARVAMLDPISTRDWLGWWAAQMSLYQQYDPGFLQAVGLGALNGSLWTIPIELEFYLLLPVIYATFHLRERRGDVALICVLACSLALHAVYAHPALFPGTPPHALIVETAVPYLWMFLVGVLLQRHWVCVRGWFAGRALWWFLGYVLLGVVAKRLHLSVGSADINPIFLLPLAGLVMACAISQPTLSDRLLRHNDISYGTYIYHALVLNSMLLWGIRGDFLSAVAAIVFSLGLGAASWWVVERPFLRRKRRSLRAALQAPPARRLPKDAAGVAAVARMSAGAAPEIKANCADFAPRTFETGET
jgi:peptidoglycan/LPS O-acetylase OafA/YrhL